MTRAIKIYPSVLAADFGNLEAEGRRCLAAGADGLHMDIMDGHFVPNLTMGPAFVRMFSSRNPLHQHVHLMLLKPRDYIRAFKEAGARTLLIHVEAEGDLAAALREIRELGVRPGITLNPGTPGSAAEPYLDLVDEVLCMTVRPGFGGQSFMPEVLETIAQVHAACVARRRVVDISVDGGIDERTAPLCAARGANAFIAGTYLFKSADLAAAMRHLRSIIAPHLP